MVRANLTLLEKENTKYKSEIGDLSAKVKAAIRERTGLGCSMGIGAYC